MIGTYNKLDIIGAIVKNAEMNLEELRATRIPSKRKKELRRKYAKKYGRK